MTETKMTYAELLQQRHAKVIVGRSEERAVFRRNLDSAAPDYLIYAIHGQAGIGKSFLVDHYQAIVKSSGALTALTNEAEAEVIQEQSILRSITRLAKELEEAGAPLKAFNERYQRYRECVQQVQADPKAPPGGYELLGRTITRLAIGGVRMIPMGQAVGGFMKDVGVDDEVLVEQAGLWTKYLLEKFKNTDDVALVKDPVANLTPIFVLALNSLAAEHRVVLCFDTWEQTGLHLSEWLRGLLEQGGLSTDVWLVIAGRNRLEDDWQPFYPIMAVFELNQFSEEETRVYLKNQGITEETRVSEILTFSDGIPVLVSTLASAKGGSAVEVANGLVDRYLKWVNDPRQHQAALNCAVARMLNKDVVEVVVGEDDAVAMFEWLTDMPFIQSRPNYWEYHPKVRYLMLHFVQSQSSKNSRILHGKLEAYYQGLLAEKGEDPLYHDDGWRRNMLEALYHGLMKGDTQAVCFGLEAFLLALRGHYPFAGEVAATWRQAADEQLPTNEVTRLAQLLSAAWAAFENRSWEAVLSLCEALNSYKDLSDAAKIEVFILGGYAYASLKLYKRAVEGFGRALELDHNSILALVGRGETYRLMDRYEEAIADFTCTLEIDANNARVLRSRGVTYRQMKRFDQALADFNQAIELRPDYAHDLIHRGETYRLMERFDEALDDMNRAIALKPDHEWALASGGETYRLMERYIEALAELNKAIELVPDYSWALASRGATLQQMGRHKEALADLNWALELNPNDERALYHRGDTYLALGDFEKALHDLNRAIDLMPDRDWLFASRGETYRKMKRYNEALVDLNRAIDLNQDYHFALLNRGVTYMQLECFDEALEDLNRAIELRPESTWTYTSRGETYRLMECFDKALDDLNQAILLSPDNFWAYACLGETYRQMGHGQEALTALQQSINLKLDYGWAYYSRGLVYKNQGRQAEAVHEFRKVLEVNKNSELCLLADKLIQSLVDSD